MDVVGGFENPGVLVKAIWALGGHGALLGVVDDIVGCRCNGGYGLVLI